MKSTLSQALESYKVDHHLYKLLPLTEYTTLKGLKRAIKNGIVNLEKLETKFMTQQLIQLLPKTNHRNINTLLNSVVSNGISIIEFGTTQHKQNYQRSTQPRKVSKQQIFMSHAGNFKAKYGFKTARQMWVAYKNGQLNKQMINHLNTIQNYYVY